MAAIVGEERYVFETEWYDQQASLIRSYRLTYYPGDQTVEMVKIKFIIVLQYDNKIRKIFLKRCP